MGTRNGLMLLIGGGLGAALMYFLDPARGRRRRALLRDGLVHAGHRADHGLRVVARDASNRALGRAATLRSRLQREEPDDDVVAARVRSCLGRVVTHPSSLNVDVHGGVVTLSGPILAHEVPRLLACVRSVRGVADVRHELAVYAEAGRVPGLQGTPAPRRGKQSAFMQTNWPPAVRAFGAAAGAAGLAGFRQRSPAGLLVGASGLALLLRSATNVELRQLFGIGAPRHVVEVRKSIRIEAPVEEVYRLWEDFTNFPRFMKHVRRVRRLAHRGDDCWRWTVRAAGGLETQFDVIVTARVANALIAWRTAAGSAVQHRGRVRFVPDFDGSTTVTIEMIYHPMGGAAGHALARLLGCDPKRQLDDDLLRMKTFLETGKVPHDAAEPTADAARAPRPLPQAESPAWPYAEAPTPRPGSAPPL